MKINENNKNKKKQKKKHTFEFLQESMKKEKKNSLSNR